MPRKFWIAQQHLKSATTSEYFCLLNNVLYGPYLTVLTQEIRTPRQDMLMKNALELIEECSILSAPRD